MIVENKVKCLLCGDVIFSRHRHDYVCCGCGNIAVDGGQEYTRRIGAGVKNRTYEDLSWEIPDEVYSACADAAQLALDTGRNKYGIANAVLRALHEKGII